MESHRHESSNNMESNDNAFDKMNRMGENIKHCRTHTHTHIQIYRHTYTHTHTHIHTHTHMHRHIHIDTHT